MIATVTTDRHHFYILRILTTKTSDIKTLYVQTLRKDWLASRNSLIVQSRSSEHANIFLNAKLRWPRGLAVTFRQRRRFNRKRKIRNRRRLAVCPRCMTGTAELQQIPKKFSYLRVAREFLFPSYGTFCWTRWTSRAVYYIGAEVRPRITEMWSHANRKRGRKNRGEFTANSNFLSRCGIIS